MKSTQVLRRLEERPPGRSERPVEPQPIGQILAELLTRYQERFPGVRFSVVETPAVR